MRSPPSSQRDAKNCRRTVSYAGEGELHCPLSARSAEAGCFTARPRVSEPRAAGPEASAQDATGEHGRVPTRAPSQPRILTYNSTTQCCCSHTCVCSRLTGSHQQHESHYVTQLTDVEQISLVYFPLDLVNKFINFKQFYFLQTTISIRIVTT